MFTEFFYVLHHVVRMAERSKAPDSRRKLFTIKMVAKYSGLQMEAWVRIPLLTQCHFYFLFSNYSAVKPCT